VEDSLFTELEFQDLSRLSAGPQASSITLRRGLVHVCHGNERPIKTFQPDGENSDGSSLNQRDPAPLKSFLNSGECSLRYDETDSQPSYLLIETSTYALLRFGAMLIEEHESQAPNARPEEFFPPISPTS
jgi:hypothetical protein